MTQGEPAPPSATRRLHDRPHPRRWWIVAGLLIAAFLARAPLYLTVFPPFEGWDEYQHLGYIAYLDEFGRLPVVGSATRVPQSIRPFVMSMPHSPSGGEQVREWNALPYYDYWNAPSPPVPTGPPASSPRLYQAQHPPLAYLIDLPIWRALRDRAPLDAVYLIRALNIVFVAVALAAFAGALPRLVPAFGPRIAALALVCLHPLFFQNVARIANDGLALAAGVTGISLLVLADARTFRSRTVLGAACIAVSIWSKQTGLTLIPALVIGAPLSGWLQGIPPRRLVRDTVLSVTVLLALVAPLWLWSLRRYGAIVTTQESIELAAAGRSTVGAIVSAVATMPWRAFTTALFVPGTPWVGGWSFLPVQAASGQVYGWLYSAVIVGSAAGATLAFRRQRGASSSERSDPNRGGLVMCAIVVAFTALGMVHHGLVSHAVFGHPTTNAWYLMTALPCLMVLLVRGLDAIDRRLTLSAAALLAGLFVAIELHGTLVQMPEAYATTTYAPLQWSRLAAIHPAWLGGGLRWIYLTLHLGVLTLSFVVAGISLRRQTMSEVAHRSRA